MSVDLPEPETPVTATNWPSGMVTSMFLRLCSLRAADRDRAEAVASGRARSCATSGIVASRAAVRRTAPIRRTRPRPGRARWSDRRRR